ncbi:MAG: heparinase II/III domain-containing protein [Planctomycetota bacterium]
MRKFYSPKVTIDTDYKLRKCLSNTWIHSAPKPDNYVGSNIFRFLNDKAACPFHTKWELKDKPKLWNYNIHYFDYINSRNFRERFADNTALLDLWMQNNPLFSDPGWEPYPTSLRIINWIKYHFEFTNINEPLAKSMYIQSRFLSGNLELHIEGNHIFENYKALLFAGLFYESKEADEWLKIAKNNLLSHIKEQILPDGGHFERSPMYHSIVLEGLLDICNMLKTYDYKCELNDIIADCVPKMFDWFKVMTGPDSNYTLFGDSAHGIARNYGELKEYAEKLEFSITEKENSDIINLADSGYLKCINKDFTLFANTGSIAPAHLPAHNHADTLSFILYLKDNPFITDRGVSTYETDKTRSTERGSASHNTLVINNTDSSDMWKSFRVGKRAKVINFNIDQEKNTFEASHNGYCSLFSKSNIHKRSWQIDERKIIITDTFEGNCSPASLYLHFAPGITIEEKHENTFICSNGNDTLEINFDIALNCEILDTEYSPEFGIINPRKSLKASGSIDKETPLSTVVKLV